MGELPELLDHLRHRAQLPERQLGLVEAALRKGAVTPEVALLEAGVEVEQISKILAQLPHPERAPERVSGGGNGERASPSLPPSRPPVVASDGSSAFGSVAMGGPVRAPSEPSVDDLIGRLMDITPRFEIQGEIARGAMGRILAAWDLHLGRPVAIKVLRKTAARDLDRVRFLEEAQVTGQLAHPSVMPVYGIYSPSPFVGLLTLIHTHRPAASPGLLGRR